MSSNMRNIIITVAMLTPLAASADVLVYAKMNGGAILALSDTDVGCRFGKDALLIPPTKNRQSLGGCWGMKDDVVTVNYNDGDQRKYPIDIFTVFEGRNAPKTRL